MKAFFEELHALQVCAGIGIFGALFITELIKFILI